MTKNFMKPLAAGLSGWLLVLLTSVNAGASPPTEIQFAKGAVQATWTGTISDGEKNFRLRLGKGQSLMVGGDDVYTWVVTTPKGDKLACDGSASCAPESEISPLPHSGVYIITTTYRMSNCATCPVAKTRKVTVIFEAR